MSFNWQAHFPMLQASMNGKRLAYLDSAATALKPVKVAQVMTDYLTKHTSNVHRGIYRLSEENTNAYEVVRDQVKDFIHANAREEIIFTRGTTEAINLVAQSWGRQNIGPGDEIILTLLEHHSNIVPWQMLAEEKGAIIKVVPLTEDGQLDLVAAEKLFSKRTKILAMTMISNTLGVITPVDKMIALARSFGAHVLLDAAQAAPHQMIDVQALKADFLAFSAHKVFGPNGVGVLWARQELLEAMTPWQGGGNMIATVSFEKTTWNKLPEKFEAGTPVIAEVLGFGAALEFVSLVGWSEIHAKDVELNLAATRALSAIQGLKIFAKDAPKIATFGFMVEGLHPQDLGSVLDKEGVAIRTGHHCTQPLLKSFGQSALARASFGPYNTTEDIQQLVAGIEKARRLFL
ncbi:MAG: aminotransferase class V-fold PLP-dependent enzyme [Bacteriovoracia bacterium]